MEVEVRYRLKGYSRIVEKVILISQEFPKTQGGVFTGVGSYTDTLSKLLISRGIQVIVLTEGQRSKEQNLEVIGRESSNLWSNLSTPEGVCQSTKNVQ